MTTYYNRFSKDFCKDAIDFFSAFDCEEYWKTVMIDYVKICHAIENRDIIGFIDLKPENHYLLFSSPEFIAKPSDFDGNMPFNGCVFMPLSNDEENKYRCDLSIYMFIKLSSSDVYPNDEDWDFFKAISDYFRITLNEKFKESFSISLENLSHQKIMALENDLSDFISYWQNYIHFLRGGSDVLDFEETREYWRNVLPPLLKAIVSLRAPKERKNPVNDIGDLFFIRDLETFKAFLPEIHNKHVERLISEQISRNANSCFWVNVKACLETLPERNLEYLEVDYWCRIFYILSGSLDEPFPGVQGWDNFLDRKIIEGENAVFPVFNLLIDIFQKKYEFVEKKKIDKSFLYLLACKVSTNKSARKRKARPLTLAGYSLPEVIFEDFLLYIFNKAVLANTQTLNVDSLFDFLMYLQIEPDKYQVFVDKVHIGRQLDNIEISASLDEADETDFKL